MSLGDPPYPWDPTRPNPDDPDQVSAALHPTARGDSIVATWGLLALGHVFGGCFGIWALIWGGLQAREEDPAPAIAAVILITVLGWTGAAVCIRMLSATARARLAIDRHRPPPPVSPPPMALTSSFVVLAVCAGVMAVFLWQAIGVIPAVAIELMLIPLAMRTERFIRDAADETWR